MNAAAVETSNQNPDASAMRLTASDRAGVTNAQQYAAQMLAHAEYLIEHQRRSGARVRPCLTGCYSLYDKAGHYIGKTPPSGALLGVAPELLKASAMSMALGGDMLNILRLVDADVEASGTVASATVDLARALIAAMEAA